MRQLMSYEIRSGEKPLPALSTTEIILRGAMHSLVFREPLERGEAFAADDARERHVFLVGLHVSAKREEVAESSSAVPTLMPFAATFSVDAFDVGTTSFPVPRPASHRVSRRQAVAAYSPTARAAAAVSVLRDAGKASGVPGRSAHGCRWTCGTTAVPFDAR